MTEYEQLMNSAAKLFTTYTFDNMRQINKAFVSYIQDRGDCYSREAIRHDSVQCLKVVTSGRVWMDRKGRIKHDPDTLNEIRKVTKDTQGKLDTKTNELVNYLRSIKGVRG